MDMKQIGCEISIFILGLLLVGLSSCPLPVSVENTCDKHSDCIEGYLCDLAKNKCIPCQDCRACASPADCNDDNLCTDDICPASGICQNDFNTAPCDDGVFCNGADVCDGKGTCVHPGDPCKGLDCDEEKDSCPCNQHSDCIEGYLCDLDQQQCVSCTDCRTCTSQPGCDDDNVCTDDTCPTSGICKSQFNTIPCDDGLFCNGADVCDGKGTCAHTGDPCKGLGCDEEKDTCACNQHSDCMDGYLCNLDQRLCVQCEDCRGCARHADCDDGDVCTEDICPLSGICMYEQKQEICDGVDNDCDGSTDEDIPCLYVAGILHHNGTPMSTITDVEPSIWVRNEDTGQSHPDIITQYDPADGTYAIYNLPENCGIPVSFHTSGEYATLPGNYDVFVSWDSSMPPELDIGLLQIIHLVLPWDNNNLWDCAESDYHVYTTSTILFEWESVPGSTSYGVTIDRCRDPEHPEGYGCFTAMASETVGDTVYEIGLPDSEAQEHYEFSITAYNDTLRIGYFMQTMTCGWGWDYRYKIQTSF